MGKENACNALGRFHVLGHPLAYLWIQAEINEASAERRTWSRILNETIEEHQALQFRLSELQSAQDRAGGNERLGMKADSGHSR